MKTNLPIIDAHAHVIPRIAGRNRFGGLAPERWGVVRRGGERLPLLPPTCAESTFPVEALVELMDREGAAQAVLLQNPTLGTCPIANPTTTFLARPSSTSPLCALTKSDKNNAKAAPPRKAATSIANGSPSTAIGIPTIVIHKSKNTGRTSIHASEPTRSVLRIFCE